MEETSNLGERRDQRDLRCWEYQRNHKDRRYRKHMRYRRDLSSIG